MAFSVYLQHVQRRLMIGSDQEKQTDLVFRFLRSATRTLHLPINVQVRSSLTIFVVINIKCIFILGKTELE